MKNPKLIDGLNLLDKAEWISFRKYILMYCTKSSDNYKLLDYLYSIRDTLPELPDVGITKQPLFNEMSTKSFSNLMSRIYNWFEEWVVWYEYKKDGIASDIQLVKIYNRKGAFNLADKTYRRVEKKLLNRNQLDLRKHRDLYELHHYHYFSDNPVKYKRKEEILNSLISYFLLQFKEQASLYIAELHNWGIIQNHSYSKEISILTHIGSLVKDSPTSDVIELIILIVSDLNKEAFLKLREVVTSNQLKPGSELYMLASLYMITFSLRLWNNNKISDPQLVLDAYDYGLESGVLLSTGKIPVVRFFNLVTTLGHINSYSKTYDFIDKWIHKVDTENHEAFKALGYAQVKFIEEKYEDIIPLLLGQKFDNDLGKLRASSLELISLYSDRKNNYNLLVNRINNFKRVLNTYGSKRSNATYRSYINFTKILDLLVKRDFIKLKINIENYFPIIYIKWLTAEIKAGQK